jgi:hypothetical protein
MSTHKQNAFDPVYPDPMRSVESFITRDRVDMSTGLTKIELFAAMAMQSLLTGKSLKHLTGEGLIETVAKKSIEVANALLIELEK